MTPKRIQRKRTKGWRMPAGAIYVGRPSRWGNPFVIRDSWDHDCEEHDFNCARTAESAVHKFRHAILWPITGDPVMPTVDEIRAALRGKDLACWCPLEDGHGERVPCHADVLLEIANS